ERYRRHVHTTTTVEYDDFGEEPEPHFRTCRGLSPPLDPPRLAVGPLLHRCLSSVMGSDPEGHGPVRDGDPALPVHASKVDTVQPLMPLGAERERGADTEVKVAARLERLAKALPGQIGARSP